MPLNPPPNLPLQFAPAAQTDLESIADFIAQDSPAHAVRFISALRVQCQRLTKAPMAYVARPELGEGLRSCARLRAWSLRDFLSPHRRRRARRAHPAQCPRHTDGDQPE